MSIRFYIDPDTGRPHIEQHGVTEREVLYVLTSSGRYTRGREGTRIVEGQTPAGEDVQDGFTLVITAYDMTRKGKAALRRGRR